MMSGALPQLAGTGGRASIAAFPLSSPDKDRSESRANSVHATLSPTRYLGRMSWDTNLLEISPMRDLSTIQSAPDTQPPPAATGISRNDYATSVIKAKTSLTSGKSKHALTHDEAMKEVQQLLDAAWSPQKQQMNQRSAPSRDESGRVTRSYFTFAPLRDQGILLAATKMSTHESESDNEDDHPSEHINHTKGGNALVTPSNQGHGHDTDSDQSMNKYFGHDARIDYYSAYRDLHSKTHLFVQVPPEPVNTRSSLRSSASCPTTLACEVLASSSTPLSRLRSPTKSRGQSRRRHIPPILSPANVGANRTDAHDSVLGSNSPRIQFLASCIAKSRPALALVLRKDNCRAFDFSHQGLGDDFIVDFAACLPEIPLVEAINVSENSLSDWAINSLLHALENKPNLFYLNISGNSIGYKSASTLRAYISSSLCTLKTLILDDADVDDKECALFMMSFERNKSVETLSMKTNSIGQPPFQQPRGKKVIASPAVKSSDHEMSERVEGQANLPSGGEAIGAMLNVNLNIQKLDLSWNAVKADSAAPIAIALQLNYHLRELTLSHNTVGDGGALALGQALRGNSTLHTLRLEYNAIGGKGALGLSSGLAANNGLHELVLDGNPIGLDGGKALMRASCTRPPNAGANSTFCRLSLLECNLTKAGEPKRQRRRHRKGKLIPAAPMPSHEKITVFDPNEPAGSYVLNLGEPYENVVAHELFRLGEDVNGTSEYRFSRIEFTPAASGAGKPSIVKLEHVKVLKKAATTTEVSEAQIPISTLDSNPTDLAHRHRHRSKSAIDLLFQRVDSDGSGSVDHQELLKAMSDHGISVAGADLSRLLQEYDYDGSGSLQAHEFSDLFFRCGFAMIDSDHSGSLDRREVSHVLALMGINNVNDTEIARMLARYDLDNSGEIDEQEFLAFLKAEILGDSDGGGEGNNPSQSSTQPGMVEQWIIRDVSTRAEFVIGTSGTLSLELVHCPQATDDLTGDMAMNRTRLGRRISDAFVSKLMTNVQGISKNVTEQREFLHLVLEESELLFSFPQAMSLLNKQAGALKTQRRRLEGMSRLLPQMASRHDAGSLVAQLVDSNDQWIERFALRSRLGRLFSVLLGSLTNAYTFVLDNDDDRTALKRLAQIAQEEKLFSKNRSGRGDTSQHGDWENFRNGTLNGKSVLLTSTFILNSLLGPSSSLPPSLLASAPPHSQSAVTVSFHYVSTLRPPRGTQPLSRRRFDQLKRVLQHQLPKADEIREFSSKIWAGEDELTADEEESRQRARLNWDLVRQSVLKRSTEKEALSMARQIRQSLEVVQNQLALLEMLVADRWLSCQQALELVADFPNVLRARSKAACVLFSHIIDLHNFIQIYDMLAPDDQAECVRRLGWLNIFDPNQPDRDYPPLDLGVRDERELVQILAQLAVHEGKKCWGSATYRTGASNEAASIPSNLEDFPPTSWGNPDAIGQDALRHHGIVKLRYHSPHNRTEGEDQQLFSGRSREEEEARDSFRRELRRRVLCGTRLFL